MRKFSAYGPSLIVLGTAILVLFFGPTVVQQLTYKQTRTRMIEASNRLANNGVLEEFNQAYQDIASLVEPSVVHISAQQAVDRRRGRSTLSSGSGWIYDKEGAIVTNYHVVREAERIDVQLSSGQLREAELIGFDSDTDIAVIRIAAGHLHPAVRADAKAPVRQGDLVFAFGSPFDFRFSMSSGIVSGQGRSADVLGRGGYENFIQVDAAINPGNSGGPLTNYRGHVIGMNTAIATSRRGSLDEGQFAGIGLAIPLEMIEPVVQQILETGVVEKGCLGVNIDALDQRIAQRLYGFIGNGVRISGVEPDSPAMRAGLREHDIVTEVNGYPIGTQDQLRSKISSLLPGAVAELKVFRPDPELRTGQTITLSATLERLDTLRANGTIPLDQRLDAIIGLGIAGMETSTPRASSRLGIPFHEGVLVTKVVRGSRLALRIRAGTTIVSVWDRPIATVEEFVDRLRGSDLTIGVQVTVIPPGGTKTPSVLQVERR